MITNAGDFLRNPKKEISVNGKVYSLKKSAIDPSIKIDHAKFRRLNSGCSNYPESQALFIFWEYGIMVPDQEGIQIPVEIIYFGVKNYRIMSSQLTEKDLNECNVYMCDMSNFIQAAVMSAITYDPVDDVVEEKEPAASLDDILEIAENEGQ